MIIWSVYLGILAFKDMKSHSVSWCGLFVGLLLFLGSQCFLEVSNMERFLGIFIGGCFLVISRFTGESIGYGDGVLFVFLGGTLGIEQLVICLISGFLLCAIYGIVMIAIKKYRKDEPIAFLPFLFLGYLIAGSQIRC